MICGNDRTQEIWNQWDVESTRKTKEKVHTNGKKLAPPPTQPRPLHLPNPPDTLYFNLPLVSPPISPLIAREPMPLLWADTQKASACASALWAGKSPDMFSIPVTCLLSQRAVLSLRVAGSTGLSSFAPLIKPRQEGLLQAQVNPCAYSCVRIFEY